MGRQARTRLGSVGSGGKEDREECVLHVGGRTWGKVGENVFAKDKVRVVLCVGRTEMARILERSARSERWKVSSADRVPRPSCARAWEGSRVLGGRGVSMKVFRV